MNTNETTAYYRDNPAALWIAYGVICLGTFFSTITVSAVNISIPEIARELNASAVQVAWLPSAFILSNILFILPFGRLADTHGRKKIYVLGLTLFSLSSLLSALVGNMEQLLVMRAIQGIAGAMIFATGLGLVVSIIPVAKRGIALGTASACVYLGLASGPAVGGLLTEYYGWRSVFFFQVPFTVLAILLILYKVKGDWKNDLNEPLDWQGVLLFMAWVVSLFLGISLLPKLSSLLFIPLAVALLVVFVRHQLNREYPLIRFQPVLENKMLSKSLLSSLLMNSATYPMIFLLSLYFQYIWEFSPAKAGQLLVLPPVVVAMMAPLAGKLSDHFDTKRIATMGCLLSAVGLVALVGVTDQSTLLYTLVGLTLFGAGVGFFTTPNNHAAMSSVPEQRLGIASALMSLSRTSGNMLGALTVMLLFTVKIGGQEILPENYPSLTGVIYWMLGLSCCYALIAAWLSYSSLNGKEQAGQET